jgi:hypothetical protein
MADNREDREYQRHADEEEVRRIEQEQSQHHEEKQRQASEEEVQRIERETERDR